MKHEAEQFSLWSIDRGELFPRAEIRPGAIVASKIRPNRIDGSRYRVISWALFALLSDDIDEATILRWRSEPDKVPVWSAEDGRTFVMDHCRVATAY